MERRCRTTSRARRYAARAGALRLPRPTDAAVRIVTPSVLWQANRYGFGRSD